MSDKYDSLTQAEERIEFLEAVLGELVEVAILRGDNNLPHSADDPALWTARMQEAWDEARDAIE